MDEPPPITRRAFLLSGSIGMGHHATAAGCAASLAGRGWSTDTLDAMDLLGGWEHRASEAVFRSLFTVPGIYDALHFGALVQGGALARFLDGQAVRRIVPRLRTTLERAPGDLVVSVFATGASAVGRLRPAMPNLRTVTLCTDLNPHRLWVHPTTDAYLVTSEASAAFVRRFDPEARIVVAPRPVRPEFRNVPNREDAREGLQIPVGAPCVLVMAGAWGLGPLVEITRSLADAGMYTITVAGRNPAAERRLRAEARADPRILAFGFTDRVPELIAACDVVVTTSGNTCSEARTVGRRLVLLDMVAGHGRENLLHELEIGDAVVASTDPALLARTVLHTLAKGSDPPPDDGRHKRWERGLDEVLAIVNRG